MKKSYITGKNHDFYSKGKAMFDQIQPITQGIPQIPQKHSSNRQWVGLTDEEIADCAEKMEASDPTDSFWREFFRGIEAKLKEKNT